MVILKFVFKIRSSCDCNLDSKSISTIEFGYSDTKRNKAFIRIRSVVRRRRLAIVSLPPSITYTWNRGRDAGWGDRITVIEMRRVPRFFPNLNFDKARPCFVLLIPSWSERVAGRLLFISIFCLYIFVNLDKLCKKTSIRLLMRATLGAYKLCWCFGFNTEINTYMDKFEQCQNSKQCQLRTYLK